VWVTVVATGLGGSSRRAERARSFVTSRPLEDVLEPPSFLQS
jgi:hypothetical protein